VIKNGIQFTGMPARGPSLTDKDFWDVAAFLAALPKMAAADHDAIVVRHPETAATR